MKRLSKKKYFAITFFLIAIISMLSCASYLYNKSIEDRRRDANLMIKSVDIPEFKIVYAEGGTGDTIILLHGNGANKDFWLSFAKYLTPNYRVIIPDLPGMGDSSRPLDKNYSIVSQMERVSSFAKELNLTKFHLAGHSMGGAIAGNYAATYPQMVKTLALFDSGGVKSPVKSELTLLREKGINPYVIKDENDFDKLLKMRFAQPPQMSPSLKECSIEQAMKDATLNEKIGKDILSDVFVLENRLNRITSPTLIVWGDADQILHISSVSIFEKKIKNSQSAIIKNCGHASIIEKPTETASIYQGFLKGKN